MSVIEIITRQPKRGGELRFLELKLNKSHNNSIYCLNENKNNKCN